MTFKHFDEHHRPKRGLAIRITTHALGLAGMAVATWLGKRRERKRQQAVQAARDKARR
jgi:hypothetical protein